MNSNSFIHDLKGSPQHTHIPTLSTLLGEAADGQAALRRRREKIVQVLGIMKISDPLGPPAADDVGEDGDE